MCDTVASLDARHHSVAVHLFAQEAKAWARLGDRRQTEVAPDKGRRLLDTYGHLFPDAEDLGRGAIEATFAAAATEQGRNQQAR